MEFSEGHQFLVTDSFNDNKGLPIQRGEMIYFVKSLTIEQKDVYVEGDITLNNLWCVCRNADGEEGKVMLRMIEPQFQNTLELDNQLDMLKDQIRHILKNPLANATMFRDIATSHVKAAELLFQMGALKPLIKQIAVHPSDGKNETKPSRFLSDMVATIAFMCKCPLGNVAEKSCSKVVKKKGLLPKLTGLVHSLYTGNNGGKSLAPAGAPSAELLAAVGRSSFGNVVCNATLIETCLKIISDPDCALYKNKTNVAKFLPTIVNLLSAIVVKGSTLSSKILKDSPIKAVLQTMTEEKHTRGPYILAQTALLFLNDNIEEKKTKKKKQLRKHESSASEGHVMVSYNWSTQDLALRVAQFLKEMRYRVWIDVEKMRGNVAKKMASAVENASVAVVLYSTKYSMSPNCLMEAEYISLLKKDMIPVFAEPGAEDIRGLLGILRGRKMYVDLTPAIRNPEIFDDRAKDLVFLIGRKGQSEVVGEIVEVDDEEDPEFQNVQLTLARRVEILEEEKEKLEKKNLELEKRLERLEKKLLG